MSNTSMFFDIFGRDVSASSTIDHLSGKVKGSAGHFGALGAAATVGLGMVAVGVEKSVSAYDDYAESVFKVRESTGGTAEDASKLTYALSAVGISADDAARPINKFSKNLDAANDGGKKHAAMVKELGFEYLDANGKILPMSELMPKLSDTFEQMPDGPEKTALAMKLFGKSGADMLPFLNEGTEAMKQSMNAAEAQGQVLGGEAVEAAHKQMLAQKEMDNAMKGVMLTIGGALVPALYAFQGFLTNNVIPAIQGAIAWFKGLSPEAQSWVTVLGAVVLIGGPLVLIIGKLAGAVSAIINVVKLAQGAFMALNAVLAANPFILVILGIAALVASLVWAYNNVGWFKDFVDSAFKVIQQIVGAVIQYITGVLVPLFVNGWQNAANQFQAVSSFVTSAFQNVSNFIGSAISGIVGFFRDMGTNISNVWNSIVSGVQDAVGRVLGFFGGLPGKIQGFFAGAAGWLLGIGGQIIGGLISGIQGALGGLGDVLGSVGKFIADHKGPEDYDRKLLIPHGGWIMGGLIGGIRAALPSLGLTLGDVTNTISNGVNAAGSLALGGTSGSGRSDNVGSNGAPVALDLHGYSLKLNADATMATFQRNTDASVSAAINTVNDDIYRGRAR